MNTDTRGERWLANAGVVLPTAIFTAEIAFESSWGGLSIGSLIAPAMIVGFALRSVIRWRRGSADWPSFAWFCAIVYATHVALVFSVALVVPLPDASIASAVDICFAIGIAVGLLGVFLIKRKARARIDRAYSSWRRSTTGAPLPPPPPL